MDCPQPVHTYDKSELKIAKYRIFERMALALTSFTPYQV